MGGFPPGLVIKRARRRFLVLGSAYLSENLAVDPAYKRLKYPSPRDYVETSLSVIMASYQRFSLSSLGERKVEYVFTQLT